MTYKDEFFNHINELEQLVCKLNSCQSIVAICAERCTGDESGALWAVSDILSETEQKMDDKISLLLEVYRKIPKGKKK